MHRNHSFRKQTTLLTLVLLLSVVALASAGTVSEAAPQQSPERSPLRVMVPTDQTWANLKAQGYDSMFEKFPNLTPESFRPGPRMPYLNRLDQRLNNNSGPNMVMAPTTFRTLAILVDFSDNTATAPATFFDTLLFSTSGSKTMNRFYNEASYGLLDIVTVNLPSALGWKRMPESYSYYVNGRNCTGGYPRNCQKLTEDAVAAVNSVVNFANYDNDGDGYVDTVFVIHAGPGAEASGGDPNMIWSHSWWVWNEPVVDGVRIGSYTTEPEFWFNVSGSTSDMTHGVYAHELGHALGLPDLYDVDYTSEGVGRWSMMSGGSWNGTLGNTPAQFDAWSRVFLGFNDPVNITGTEQTITIPNVLQNQSNSIFRLNGANAKEYWLLENRQQLGSDAALPGYGLLIWHVDDNVGGSNRTECKLQNNYQCSGTNKHFRVALEQADGLYQLEFGTSSGNAGDPFPGTSNNRRFNVATNPNSTSYYTQANIGISIWDISDSSATMTAKIGPLVTNPATLFLPLNNAQTNDATPTFAWNTAANEAKYQLQVDDDPGFGSPAINRTQIGASFTPLTNLGSTTWYWHVRASGVDGLPGPWSDTWSFTVDRVRPVAPAPVSPALDEKVSDNTPLFQWSLVGDAASYTLRVDRNQLFNTPDLKLYTGLGTNSYEVPDTLIDGRWFWQVLAVDAAGNQSLWSAKSRVLVDAIPTPIPTLLGPADLLLTKDGVHTFQWSDESPNAVRYNLLIANEPSFTAPYRVNVKVNGTSFRNAALPLGNGTWYWRVIAQGPDGIWGDPAPFRTLIVDRVKPTRPTLFDPPNGSTTADNTPTFMWNAVPDVDVVGYVIQIDKNNLFANTSPDKITVQVAGTSYTPGVTLYDRRWFWRVAAVDAAGNVGPWSLIWNVTVNTGAPSTGDDGGGDGKWWQNLTDEQRRELLDKRNNKR